MYNIKILKRIRFGTVKYLKSKIIPTPIPKYVLIVFTASNQIGIFLKDTFNTILSQMQFK